MAKRQHKKKASSVRIGEQAPKERRQHNQLTYEVLDRDADGRIYIKRQRVVDECRLDIYLNRNWITAQLHQAGMKFRHAYVRFHFHIRVDDSTPNRFLNEAGGGSAEDAMLTKIASEELLKKVYKILSPSQCQVVIAVCGHDEFAGTTAKVKTLCRALEKMAAYWHLI